MRKGFKKNRLAVAIGACIALSSSVVQALGVGEIEVETALNEPLVAKIMLTSASAEELNTLSVDLAPREVFSRMGIERLPVLRELEFELIVDGVNTPYVAVSSRKSVREPFLDFILKLDWANGQMLREYTLLLDPPIFVENEIAGKVSAPISRATNVVRESRPTPVSRMATGSYGPTSRVDTLWAVSSKMRPSRDVSVPQMMIALLKENPDAFDRGNINNLKAGYILRSPEMDVITALTKPQAANEASRQYQDWLADRGKGPRPAPRTQQRVVSEPAIAAPAVNKALDPHSQKGQTPEARLQLLTADEEARIRSGVGSGAADGGETSGGALKQELAIAVEAGETMRQENNELRERLAELESQLQSVQKLLTLKDDTLGSLQATQQEEVAVPPVAEAQVEESKSKPKPVVPPVAVVEPEASLVDDLLGGPNMPIVAGGGLLALLLGGWMFVRRRRQSEKEDEILPVVAGAAVVATETVTADEAIPDVPSEDVSLGDFGDAGAIHAEESEIDPIAEADVYLAYRRYEQAEALMKEAIASDSGRAELKLKLLEIYFTTKDTDSFEAQAEALYASLAGQDDSVWQQAVEMGRELTPEHPLFSDGVAVESTDDLDDFASDAVDDVADQEAALDESLPASDDAVLSDDDLANSLMDDDFSLDAELADSKENGLDDLELDLGDDLGIGDDELSNADELVSLDDFDLGDDGLETIGGSESLDDDSLASALDDKLEGLVDDAEPGFSSLDDALDLGSDDIQGLVEQDEFGSALDEAFNLDDVSESLDELTASESLDELTAELDDVLVDSLDEFDLSESLAEDGDLLAGIGELDELDRPSGTSTGSDKKENSKVSLSLLDENSELEDVNSEFTEPDLESFTSEASAAWDVEPAQSVFESRDLSGKTNIQAVTPSVKPVALPGTAEESLVDIADLGDLDFGEMSDDDRDIFDSSDDMVGTKLDLAKAYIEMGDQDSANSILDEVSEEGNDNQREEAEGLKQQIS